MTDPQYPGGYPPQQPGPPQPQAFPPQPQPGYPPPGYGVPGQQPPKKKHTGLIVGLAVGIPLVLIALVVLAVVLLVGSATGPADSTNEFLKALEDGNQSALEAASCSDLVSSGELASLQAQLDQLEPTRGTLSSYNITSSSFENNVGSASGTITFTKGVTNDVEFSLVQEGGKWKVCGIQEK